MGLSKGRGQRAEGKGQRAEGKGWGVNLCLVMSVRYGSRF